LDIVFLNRNRDLHDFDEEARESNLVVLMGRRRVGKTELIREWARRGGFPSASRYYEGGDIEIDSVRFSSETTITVSEVKFRPVSASEKSSLLEKLKRNFERSQLSRFAAKYNIDYEVVDWRQGISDIIRQQPD